MTNNDVLRRIRYTFNFNDKTMIQLFAEAGHTVTREQVSDWLKKDDDPAYQDCSDVELAIFLNGLINLKRGKREGPQPEPEQRLSNNIIFMKLKIALNLQADEILEIMNRSDFRLSKHELSAFFRKSSHKHFRKCQDQVLRHFLKGLQATYRTDTDSSDDQEHQVDATTPDLAPVETTSTQTAAATVEPEVESVWRRKKP